MVIFARQTDSGKRMRGEGADDTISMMGHQTVKMLVNGCRMEAGEHTLQIHCNDITCNYHIGNCFVWMTEYCVHGL